MPVESDEDPTPPLPLDPYFPNAIPLLPGIEMKTSQAEHEVFLSNLPASENVGPGLEGLILQEQERCERIAIEQLDRRLHARMESARIAEERERSERTAIE
jgi:hypothetical protein